LISIDLLFMLLDYCFSTHVKHNAHKLLSTLMASQSDDMQNLGPKQRNTSALPIIGLTGLRCYNFLLPPIANLSYIIQGPNRFFKI
jgi:hypothetical protein